ncbi:MAG: restriction endonuclease [Nitrososphaerales archaeon]
MNKDAASLETVARFLARVKKNPTYGPILTGSKTGVRISKPEVLEILKRIEHGPSHIQQTIWHEWTHLLGHPRIMNVYGESLSESQFLLWCDPYNDFIQITYVPDWGKLKDTSRIMQESLANSLYDTITTLSQPASVELTDNVLSNDKLSWIRDFRLSPTASRDGGRDFSGFLIINKNREIAVSGNGREVALIGQLKHKSSLVGSPEVDEFVGTLARTKTKNKAGLFISTRGFSDAAILAAGRSPSPIVLRDARWLVELIIKYGIGLKKISINVSQMDEVFWNEIRSL